MSTSMDDVLLWGEISLLEADDETHVAPVDAEEAEVTVDEEEVEAVEDVDSRLPEELPIDEAA